jgi:hypothetical protein
MLRLVLTTCHIKAQLVPPLDCVLFPLWCTQGEFAEVTSEQMATAEAGQGLRGVHVDPCDPNIVKFKFFYRGTRIKKVRSKAQGSTRSDGPSTHRVSHPAPHNAASSQRLEVAVEG